MKPEVFFRSLELTPDSPLIVPAVELVYTELQKDPVPDCIETAIRELTTSKIEPDYDPHYFCLTTSEELIAVGALSNMQRSQAWVDALAVAPHLRRQGYGGLMLQELEREAADRGVKRLKLYPSDTSDEFYIACGYAKHPGDVITYSKWL